MAAAAQRFDASAKNVATATTGAAGPTADVATELVSARVTAPAAYAANAQMFPPRTPRAARCSTSSPENAVPGGAKSPGVPERHSVTWTSGQTCGSALPPSSAAK